MTECGGCISDSYAGDYDGTREGGYLESDPTQVTTISGRFEQILSSYNGNTKQDRLTFSVPSMSIVEASNLCEASECPDAASLEAKYNEVVAAFVSFLSNGQLESEIHSWANERLPPVPELFAVSVDTASFVTDGTFTNPLSDPQDTVEAILVTTTGELTVPDLNEEVEVVQVTTTGTLSTDLDTSAYASDPASIAEVSEYFEDAIAQELESQGLLPAGSTVTVTSISSNGDIEYEIVTNAESTADANTAVSEIQGTLSDSLASIESSVETAATASTNSDITTSTANMDVAASTSGTTSTPTTTTQVIVQGTLAVDAFDPSAFSSEESEEAKDLFEGALIQELEEQGLLPEGSSVVVTDINADGSVEYEIHFYGETSADASAAIDDIEDVLAQTATLSDITTLVQTEASLSTTSSAVQSSLTSVSVSGNTQEGTSGLTMTEAELEDVMDYFEDAITASLGTDLPEGSSVTVKGIVDGVVSYEISVSADSSALATAAVTTINSSLSDDLTLAAITTSVIQASSTSSNPTLVNALLGTNVESNTAGTAETATVAKVTSEGQLTTNLSGLSASEVTEASEYFEGAITKTLEADGALPEGSVVSVTGIDSNGVVSYEIIMYLTPGGDNAILVNGINSKLSSTSTQAAIATEVESEASSSGSLIGALSNVDVTGFIEGESSGVSFEKWYPNWIEYGSHCLNDGNQPLFMRESTNSNYYLFNTQKECCQHWYGYSDSCEIISGNPDAEKYYPLYSDDGCAKKKVTEFKHYEMETAYDTLVECCDEKFFYDKKTCCESPGMGGCSNSSDTVYYPDWLNNVCEEREEATLSEHEKEYSNGSLSSCCSRFFGWSSDCREKSKTTS